MKINDILKNRKVWLVLMLLAMFFQLLTCSILADNPSLWSDEAAGMYQAEEKKYKVGDIVTVIIEESISANQSASTSTSQESDAGAGPGLGIFDFLSTFSFNYSDDEQAGGETEQSRNISADITVKVKEKLDNGNLKIEGTKSIIVNKEEQIIKLTGVINPDDIQEDNIVTSRKVADASIEFEGEGVIDKKQDPNIFQRILNWIF